MICLAIIMMQIILIFAAQLYNLTAILYVIPRTIKMIAQLTIVHITILLHSSVLLTHVRTNAPVLLQGLGAAAAKLRMIIHAINTGARLLARIHIHTGSYRTAFATYSIIVIALPFTKGTQPPVHIIVLHLRIPDSLQASACVALHRCRTLRLH